MRKLPGFAIVCCALAVGSTSAVSQQVMDTPSAGPVCRTVTGTADIDGAPQQFSGLACLQPDGTWTIVQADYGTLSYPAEAWPAYGWWPPVAVGASFIFIDRFHRFHPIRTVRFVHPGIRVMPGMHGGFRGDGFRGDGFRGDGFRGGFRGGFHGGDMIRGGMGGGHHR
ncbi:hypothetical protein [Paraburkholderia sp.]|uniref:hypothetical protein n=1 Tax=Paraburkholderia sp. TaxID=1926495 RepID=UPI0025E10606|nr:hypothetical protein [Paraburkholderia sp.]